MLLVHIDDSDIFCTLSFLLRRSTFQAPYFLLFLCQLHRVSMVR